MLRMTKKVDYSLLILAYLKNGRSVSAREVAEIFSLPPSLTANILKELCSTGMLKSSRGKLGGYSLNREPTDITLIEVFEAMEGPIALAGCLNDSSECKLSDVCTSCRLVIKIDGEIKDVLQKYTLADIETPVPAAAEKE